jgi:hypothetical protein
MVDSEGFDIRPITRSQHTDSILSRFAHIDASTSSEEVAAIRRPPPPAPRVPAPPVPAPRAPAPPVPAPKAPTPKAPTPKSPTPMAIMCNKKKVAECVAQGKVCNVKTNRCIADKSGKAKNVSKSKAKRASSQKAKTKSASPQGNLASEISLGSRKRCPKGYKLNPKTQKCKKSNK